MCVEYHQGWLATDLESTGQKQASWHGSRAGGRRRAIGDIGTHARISEFVTGLRIEAVCGRSLAFVPGRPWTTTRRPSCDCPAARGHASASQVCVGEENN